MGTLRFAELRTRPTEVLDLTSLTVEEFRQLVPPFEAAFHTHMADWRLGVAEAEVTAMVVPSEPPPAPATVPAPASTSPLVGMMGPNGASGVPRIRPSRRAVIAARKHATR